MPQATSSDIPLNEGGGRGGARRNANQGRTDTVLEELLRSGRSNRQRSQEEAARVSVGEVRRGPVKGHPVFTILTMLTVFAAIASFFGEGYVPRTATGLYSTESGSAVQGHIISHAAPVPAAQSEQAENDGAKEGAVASEERGTNAATADFPGNQELTASTETPVAEPQSAGGQEEGPEIESDASKQENTANVTTAPSAPPAVSPSQYREGTSPDDRTTGAPAGFTGNNYMRVRVIPYPRPAQAVVAQPFHIKGRVIVRPGVVPNFPRATYMPVPQARVRPLPAPVIHQPYHRPVPPHGRFHR